VLKNAQLKLKLNVLTPQMGVQKSMQG